MGRMIRIELYRAFHGKGAEGSNAVRWIAGSGTFCVGSYSVG